MTVTAHEDDRSPQTLPEPFPTSDPVLTDRASTVIRLAGIGGTGVVTVAQILATAATMDGLKVAGLDQTGLSQKAGPVISDLTISTSDSPTVTNAPGRSQAHVLLAFDLLVAATDRSLHAISEGAALFVSTTETPTGHQVTSPELVGATSDELSARLGAGASSITASVDAASVAEVLVGSRASANILLLGAASQSGQLPVGLESIRQAIELNGVGVEANLAALDWGRCLVAHYDSTMEVVDRLTPTNHPFTSSPLPDNLQQRIANFTLVPARSERLASLCADLVDYQSETYANDYLDLVFTTLPVGSSEFTDAVARSFHKLMAYKDEYEVARLMSHPDGLAEANLIGTKPVYHLHPPLLKALGLDSKVEIDAKFVPTFKALAKGKRLRGTPFDPFGRTEMRRMERRLIEDYGVMIRRLCATEGLAENGERLALAVELAGLADMIRGYEELKVLRVQEYEQRVRELLDAFDR